MKKICLGFFAVASCGFAAKAQLSGGGLPQSMHSVLHSDYITTQHYSLPDWTTFIAKNDAEEKNGSPKPYKFGLSVNTDISFPESGVFVTAEDGTKVWRSRVQIQGAPAMGFYYDKFQLPAGVQLFLSNDNGNQVLGAYTLANNSEDKLFANEAVLGDVVNIELNISPDVNQDDIQLHINNVLVYFRSYEYLNKYKSSEDAQQKPTDPDLFGLEGGSSTCEINAICPLGQNYPKQRKSTVQLIFQGGLCSATLVNNTGNTTTSCKNYVLTATHCDPNNDTSGSTYSQLLVRFNFEKTQCTGGPAATVNTLVGVNFRARANYIETNQPEINGDFLLMQLKNPIPTAWDAYQAGWNRATTVPSTLTYPKKYIGFHHPAGDVKKVSASDAINPNGQAGGSLGNGTHWLITQVDSGGIEAGTSGSGLFDGEGRLIGIASVAGNPDPNCDVNGNGDESDFFKRVDYAKLSLAWDYSLDGAFNNRMLKPWLDPTNSGVVTLNAIKSNCSDYTPPTTSITNTHSDLENSISIYPNPTTSGIVTARINFAAASDVDVEIFNISGAKQGTYHLKNVLNGTYSFDLSTYAHGMYLIRFSNGDNITTKKIMLTK